MIKKSYSRLFGTLLALLITGCSSTAPPTEAPTATDIPPTDIPTETSIPTNTPDINNDAVSDDHKYGDHHTNRLIHSDGGRDVDPYTYADTTTS